jgi:hypothetical protein
VLITRSFRRIGIARKMAQNRRQEFLLWTIGCILCGHLGGFFGISYFDQMKYWWYVTLAMIPAAAMAVRIAAPRRSDATPVLDPMSTPRFAEPAIAGERAL